MKKFKIGDSERELLVFIANQPDSTVREAAEHFAQTRGWGRTTVLKTVERLMAKGLLSRSESGEGYRYRSTMSEAELQQKLIGQFFAGSLGGSLQPLVAFLDGDAAVSDEDLAELRQLVERLESRRRP